MMDGHEVPTHVQAEDRVLLWFTFPQIAALMALAALSYGLYHYIPVGPETVRIVIAVGCAAAGAALIVGRVGGRRLPAVAADICRFGFGPRRFVGPPSQLIRPEPPLRIRSQVNEERDVKQQAAEESGPVMRGTGKLTKLNQATRLAARAANRAERQPAKRARTRGERMPFKPRDWFRKRDQRRESKRVFDEARQAVAGEQREQRFGRRAALLAATLTCGIVTSVAVCTPPVSLADEGEAETWSSDEIEFEPAPLIPGRRLFIERLTVTRTAVVVVLRAATELEVEVRAFGGVDGHEPMLQRQDTLITSGRRSYLLPLDGPVPSFTFSWRDEFGQAGAISLSDQQLPYPLPTVEGELCRLSLVSLSWRPQRIVGSVAASCLSSTPVPVELQNVSGHVSQSQAALLPAEIAGVGGRLSVSAGSRETRVPFDVEAETRFELAVAEGRAQHEIVLAADLAADLRIALPQLVELTHHPREVEQRTETVTLIRPGTGQTVSETVTVTHEDGSTTTHVISAYLSISAATIEQDVTVTVVHPEHVRAEQTTRQPLSLTRSEPLTLMLSIASDDPYLTLAIPEPTSERTPSTQTRVNVADLHELFALLGWELR